MIKNSIPSFKKVFSSEIDDQYVSLQRKNCSIIIRCTVVPYRLCKYANYPELHENIKIQKIRVQRPKRELIFSHQIIGTVYLYGLHGVHSFENIHQEIEGSGIFVDISHPPLASAPGKHGILNLYLRAI